MRFRSLVAAFAVAMPLTMVASTPATAAGIDSVTITGSGTISPGLTLIPTPQSINFTGTATMVGTHGVPGTYSCSFSGTLYAAASEGAAGEVSGNCGPLSFYACVIVMIGPSIGFECESTPFVHIDWFSASGVFTPVDTNPTTRFNLILSGVAGSVP